MTPLSRTGIVLALLLAGTAPAAAPDLERVTYTQYHMGVDVRLVFYAPDQETARRAGKAAFDRIASLDSIMSDYRPNSELMRLCNRAGGPAVPVSRDLFRVLERAQEVARRSGGAFDVTAGPLIALWRQARKSGALPAAGDLDRARRLTGWEKLTLDAARRTARLAAAGMKLDLGGIAKGYAADCAQQELKRHGIDRALVEAGGDIVVSGPPPGSEGWTIRVPNAGGGQQPADLRFTLRALSSSGDTEQFAVIGGRRYSHIVDPRTGEALTHRVQVTVTAPDGLTSDSLATALSVLGPEAGRPLLRAYAGTSAFLRRLEGEPERGS